MAPRILRPPRLREALAPLPNVILRNLIDSRDPFADGSNVLYDMPRRRRLIPPSVATTIDFPRCMIGFELVEIPIDQETTCDLMTPVAASPRLPLPGLSGIEFLSPTACAVGYHLTPLPGLKAS